MERIIGCFLYWIDKGFDSLYDWMDYAKYQYQNKRNPLNKKEEE